jgi:hypothetical protein
MNEVKSENQKLLKEIERFKVFCLFFLVQSSNLCVRVCVIHVFF